MTEQPPRVLHVVGAMNLGGAETMVMNLYRSIDRTRLQFDFLAFTGSESAYDAEIGGLGGRILTVPPPGDAGYRQSLAAMTRMMGADGPFHVVHAHVAHASSVAMRAACKAEVPVRVTHAHSTGSVGGSLLRRRAYFAVARRVITRNATVLAGCGEDAGRYLFGKQWSERGVLIRNSIDVAAFLPGPDRSSDALRAQLGVGAETLLLGSVARMEPVKNHEFLIQVVRAARAAGLDVVLALVGDGSERGAVEAAVAGSCLEDRVRFLGLRHDVPDLMRAFDVHLLPSRREGLPVVVVEAQAAGTPSLVSSRVTAEVDLGLGLVRYLDIGDVAPWVEAIGQVGRARPSAEEIEPALASAGYDVSTSVDRLYHLYGLTP